MALTVSYVATPMYRATARFVVSPSASLNRGVDVVDSLATLDKRSIVSTYAEILNSTSLFGQTLAGLQISPDAVEKYTRSTVVLPDTSVLVLSIEGPSPKVAALLANSLGQQSIAYVKALNQVYEITVLDPAEVPTEPFRPQPLRDAGLAVALGLVAGSVLAIVRAQLLTPLEAFLQRSTIDGDSQAYTRRYFEGHVVETFGRRRVGPMSVGLIQLSGLQGFLEAVPQAIAQDVLRQAVDILRDQLRGSDVVGRWNNHTLAVLLPETPGTAAVMTLGRIQIALSKPVKFGEGETIRLQPMIGVAERKADELPETVIQWCEKALEQASRQDSKLSLFKVNPFVNP